MDEILSPAVQTVVFGRLDYLDRLIADGDQRSRAALADTEITRMTAAWRVLLAAHTPDERGRCPQCSGWRRPHRHPCSVWATAHQHLISDGGPPPATARRALQGGSRSDATLTVP